MDVAVVLEEVQVPPSFLLEVVCRTGLAADRAGVLRTTLGLHVQMQLMRLLVRIQSLVHQFPRGLYPPGPEAGSGCRPFRFLAADSPGTLAQVIQPNPHETTKSLFQRPVNGKSHRAVCCLVFELLLVVRLELGYRMLQRS